MSTNRADTGAGAEPGGPAVPEEDRYGGGRLFILSAPSGAGKTTLCTAVLARIPELRYSVS